MADLTAVAGASGPVQIAAGWGNVQVRDVSGSHIEVTIVEGDKRRVPLEPAIVPVGKHVRSPTLLVKARSGVVPFTARAGLPNELESWLTTKEPFSGLVIGGRGGSGKTRLAVELCERARKKDWLLSGLLTRIADQAALDALINTQLRRFVVIDYAETRAEQLEILLPELAAGATEGAPVRALLLIRASPQGTGNWTERLRNRSDWLDALLDQCDTHTLEDDPLDREDRERLFTKAAEAFARRADPPLPQPSAPANSLLSGEAFATPLMVVVAAYLEVHGQQNLPTTRDELFDEIIRHEERHWHASSGGLFSLVSKLPKQVAALATLCAAETPAVAAGKLQLLPQLSDATAERLDEISQWAHGLYPGADWWNPLEPDRIGEHLVATAFCDEPEIIAGVLATDVPEQITWPLTILARAAVDHPQLNGLLGPVFTTSLQHLCELALAQASTTAARELVYGEVATAATAIERAITTVPIGPDALPGSVSLMPTQANLILSSLAVTLAKQHVQHQQELSDINPAAYEPNLATSLNNFSVDLANVGLYEQALHAIQQAVEIRTRLATANPAAYEPDLASSLNNLSFVLSDPRESEQALRASQRSVEIRRRLAAADSTAYDTDLAASLHNFAVDLTNTGDREQALHAIQQAVEIYQRLAAANPDAFTTKLESSLNLLGAVSG